MAAPLKQITPDQVASFAYDPVDPRALADARVIVDDVRERGLEALKAHAARLGDIADAEQPVLVSKDELRAAFLKLPANEQQVLQRTTQRIRVFAQSQRASIGNFEQKIDGGFAGQDVRSRRSRQLRVVYRTQLMWRVMWIGLGDERGGLLRSGRSGESRAQYHPGCCI